LSVISSSHAQATRRYPRHYRTARKGRKAGDGNPNDIANKGIRRLEISAEYPYYMDNPHNL
jgi:hypothetical protein